MSVQKREAESVEISFANDKKSKNITKIVVGVDASFYVLNKGWSSVSGHEHLQLDKDDIFVFWDKDKDILTSVCVFFVEQTYIFF